VGFAQSEFLVLPAQSYVYFSLGRKWLQNYQYTYKFSLVVYLFLIKGPVLRDQLVMLTSPELEHYEPNLPRAESVRAYLVKARAQARALLIIIIIIQVYCPYRI
jgi:hypothetical protein